MAPAFSDSLLYLGGSEVQSVRLGAEEVWSPAPSGPSDPHWANVRLLVGFEGPNGGSTFTDSGPLGLTATTGGSPTYSSAQAKFGTTSGLFVGSEADRVIFSPATSLDLGSSDFTIEAWIYPITLPTQAGIMTRAHTSGITAGGWLFRTASTKISLLLSTGSGTIDGTVNCESPFSTLTTNNWQHVVGERSGNTLRVYHNGVIKGTATMTVPVAGGSGIFNVGTQYDNITSRNFDGYIEECRVTVGVARYVGNFTPPIEPFPRQ